jgi:hypothetical protein
MSNPGGVGTGIDINSVGAKVGRTYSTMAKDQDLLVKSFDVTSAMPRAMPAQVGNVRYGAD